MDNTKQSAYPFVEQGTQYESVSEGMSKLEAFTMAAMQGLCANAMLSDKMGPDAFAQDAVAIARATLAELQKQQS